MDLDVVFWPDLEERFVGVLRPRKELKGSRDRLAEWVWLE